MHLIDATNAEAYLRDSGRLAAGERVTVRELAGGVSNIVLLVEFADGARPSFVLKQAREQLRVAQPWFCSPERIWREVEVLRACCEILTKAPLAAVRTMVPQVLWEDPAHYVFAMTAAAPDAAPWKNALLRQTPDVEVAAACGAMLGQLHAGSWENQAIEQRFADRRYFEDLRVAPYYRQIAEVHPHIAAAVQALISSMDDHRQALVHGDFSPKNLLVSPGVVTLIDCEVGHFGDPTFDLGFFLTHLQLKTIHLPAQAAAMSACSRSFLHSYAQHAPAELCDDPSFEQRVFGHLRACMLARVDGKSPVEYLSEGSRSIVRSLALSWFQPRQLTLQDALAEVTATSQLREVTKAP